ncbi:MAG TPA: lactate racemase domain-containing protein [Planctomycetaceae bacterium]|jgi:nickel-dependent lactate racemase
MQSVNLKYGRAGAFSFEIDPRRLIVHHKGPAPCADLTGRLHAALKTPLDFPSLVQVCVPGDKVVVALDRHTPGSPELVATVWTMLDQRGVSAADVLILQPVALDGVALADPRSLLAEPARHEMKWTVHDPTDQRKQAYLAATARAERIYLARELVDADVVISAGMIAYDSLLGYRGTSSVFYPGLSNTEAIRRSRGEGHSELGPDDERPLRQTIDEIAWLLGTQFSIQVLPSAGGGVADVVAGAYDRVFRKGKQRLAKSWQVAIPDRAEMVVAAVEADSAGHGWEQVGAALATARNLVEKGGKIVLLSELQAEPEIGIEIIRQNRSPRAALAPIRKQAPVDMLAATQIAMTADWARVYLVSRLPTGIVDELFMVPVENQRELTKLLGESESCVILESAQHTYGTVRHV